MECSTAARRGGEARMWRAVLRLVDAELAVAYARHDRQAVRRLGAEAHGLRASRTALVPGTPSGEHRGGPDPCSGSRGA